MVVLHLVDLLLPHKDYEYSEIVLNEGTLTVTATSMEPDDPGPMPDPEDPDIPIID